MNRAFRRMDPQIKNIGFAAWTMEDTSLESMKGKKWHHILAEEKERYEKAIEGLPLNEFVAKEKAHSPLFVHGNIEILELGTFRVSYKYKGAIHNVADLDFKGDAIWTVTDKGKGGEDYCLETDKWSIKHVAPYVVVHEDRCYYLEADRLWYHTLKSVNAQTGKEEKVHYKEQNKQWNLTLIRCPDGPVLIANNAGVQKMISLEGKQLFTEGSIVPISTKNAFVNDKLNIDYQLPKGIPEYFRNGLLITRSYGVRTVWDCFKEKKPIKKQQIVGTLLPDPWFSDRILVSEPGVHPYILGSKKERYAKTSYHFATSVDGTKVPYITVSLKNIRGLLVIGYGAYGIPTGVSTERWIPLLKKGWALTFALVRGSGDHDSQWANSARTANKAKSMEDMEACIQSAQKKLGVDSTTTAIYGRSAGGYLVGSLLSRNPSGNLFGAVYTEVPYVDVLETTTNPRLPLTELEYNEFGDPKTKIQDLGAILHLSPVDTVPEKGIKSIFVLCRTAERDLEVLAYESVKWIRKLRSTDEVEPKILAITAGEGHFARNHTAEDMALLDNWLTRTKKSKSLIYKMAMTRRNRKNRAASRRNRRNNNGSTNAAMMGGKRRRSGSRRTRRHRRRHH